MVDGRPKRVLWLFEFPTLCGGERSLLATLPHLRTAGFEPLAVAPPTGPLADELHAQGVDVLTMPWRDGEARRPQEELRAEVRQLLETHQPDLVHANSLSMGRLAGPVTAALGVPSLGHLRDILKLSRQAIADLNTQDRLLAVSHATREYHIAQGLAAKKTQVLYNGVDLSQFRPRPHTGWLYEDLKLPRNVQLVGTIGQLVMRKGHDLLAQAAAIVAGQMPDVHFVIVGERYSGKAEAIDYYDQLRTAFDSGALRGRAHFLGSRNDVHLLLNELDLLVHPARQEPLGRVLLEAAAAGTAVLATDVGGTREVFPDEINAACLVPPDGPEIMARRMCELLSDADHRVTLGEAARKCAESRFDVETAAKGLATHYQEFA